MMHRCDRSVIDTEIQLEGNRLVGRDILAGGSMSCLKQDLGTYKSPEHAEVMFLLFTDLRMLVLAAEGKLTDEVIDKMAEALRQRRQTQGATNADSARYQRPDSDPRQPDVPVV